MSIFNHAVRLTAAGFFLLSSASGASTFARHSPQVDTRKEVLVDFENRNGSPLEDFFKRRDEDPALASCRTIFQEKLAAYDAARKKFNYAEMERILVGDEVMDDDTSLGLAAINHKCGRCVTKVTALGDSTYESDGWCMLPAMDPQKLESIYEKVTDRLLTLERYPKRSGGFNYVLNFDGLSSEGAPTSNSESPFFAWIVVKGIFGFAFEYVAENVHAKHEEDGVKDMVLEFESIEKPLPKFDLEAAKKNVFDHPKTASSKPLKVLPMRNVVGQWFFSSKGEYRYFTKAKILSFPFLDPAGLAFRIHQDTLIGVLLSTEDPA